MLPVCRCRREPDEARGGRRRRPCRRPGRCPRRFHGFRVMPPNHTEPSLPRAVSPSDSLARSPPRRLRDADHGRIDSITCSLKERRPTSSGILDREHVLRSPGIPCNGPRYSPWRSPRPPVRLLQRQFFAHGDHGQQLRVVLPDAIEIHRGQLERAHPPRADQLARSAVDANASSSTRCRAGRRWPPMESQAVFGARRLDAHPRRIHVKRNAGCSQARCPTGGSPDSVPGSRRRRRPSAAVRLR